MKGVTMKQGLKYAGIAGLGAAVLFAAMPAWAQAAADSAIFWARTRNSSSSRPTARGVKPREMIFRSRVCCGASMLSSTLRCKSMASRVIS